MAGLPKPDWLTLGEALELAVEITDAEQSAIQAALVRAFRDGNALTRGRCHEYFKHDQTPPLGGYIWDRADVNWKASSIMNPKDRPQSGRSREGVYTFEDVTVDRKMLERWLGRGESKHEPVQEAAPPSMDDVPPQLRPEAREKWGKLTPRTQAKYHEWFEKSEAIKAGKTKDEIAGLIEQEYYDGLKPKKGYTRETIYRQLDKFFIWGN
jgi:hypothetical protein